MRVDRVQYNVTIPEDVAKQAHLRAFQLGLPVWKFTARALEREVQITQALPAVAAVAAKGPRTMIGGQLDNRARGVGAPAGRG